jgi:MFS family permease
MNPDAKDTLTEEDFQKGFKAFIRDGLTTEVMAALTGGVFLVAFALKLGASNMFIGLLAAIPPLVQLIQIPSIYLIEKFRTRRKICMYAATSSRLFWLLIALIPFMVPDNERLTVLVIAILLSTALGALAGSSWNSWMHDFLPHNRLGSVFSKRMSVSIAMGIPFSLAAGFYIQRWGEQFPQYDLYGYSILFALGSLVGLLGIYFISTIPEPRMVPLEEKINLFELILKPLKDVNFKNLIMFLSSWNFAVNLAAPFFTVYMLKVLKLDLTLIIALMVLSQLSNVLFLRIWGRLTDRFSNKSVLGVSGPLFLLCVFAWTYTILPERHIFTILLLIAIHIFAGISTAGVTLASGNIGLKLAPKGQATAYLAANGLINSLAAGIAPILGGTLADIFTGYELFGTINWRSPAEERVFTTFILQGWGFLFLLAALTGLYSIHRLATVKETGEVEETIVMRELIAEVERGVRDISTAAGLRPMVIFPYSIVRSHLRKIKGRT